MLRCSLRRLPNRSISQAASKPARQVSYWPGRENGSWPLNWLLRCSAFAVTVVHGLRRGDPGFEDKLAEIRALAALMTGASYAASAAMARELGPKGIHVAHIVIDGAIDTQFIRENFPDLYARKAEDAILSPDHIAEMYWMLHRQPRDTWTHELDLRPWIEKW